MYTLFVLVYRYVDYFKEYTYIFCQKDVTHVCLKSAGTSQRSIRQNPIPSNSLNELFYYESADKIQGELDVQNAQTN